MRALRRALAALGAAAALAGCAGAPPAGAPAAGAPATGAPAAGAEPTAPGRFEALAARFTDRAVKAERAGDLRGALEAWRVVAAVRPGAAEPARRVADLEARLRRDAEARYRAALARLDEGATDAARRELLLALTADPDHAGALEALRARLDPDVVRHTAAAGDTFAGVAQRYLGNPALGGVVARVNGLDPAAVPPPGTTLLVPAAPGAAAAAPGATPSEPAGTAGPVEPPAPAAAETEPAAIGAEPAAPAPAAAQPGPDPDEERLARVRQLLETQRFPEAAAAAEQLFGSAAAGPRARELAAAAWFGAGDRALKEGRFDDAAAAYRRADPALRDVPAAVAAVERRRRERADERYNEGVRLFIDQKLDGAIAAWEETLALNPQHAKAPKDLEKAHALKRRLEELR